MVLGGIKLYDVPKDGFASDGDHGLWAKFGFFTKARAEAAAGDDNFHD